MSENVKELTAGEARIIADGVCDSLNETMNDIYNQVEQQAALGRYCHKYFVSFGKGQLISVIELLRKRGYAVRKNELDSETFYLHIRWDDYPF